MDIEVGRQYRIKLGFEKFRRDSDPGLNSDMRKMAGQIVTAKEVYGRQYKCVRVVENTWTWIPEWLEELEPENPYEDVTENELMNMMKG